MLGWLWTAGSQPSEAREDWGASRVLASRLDYPTGMLVDGSSLFFVTGGTVASQMQGTNNLMRMDLDGGEPQVLVKGGESWMPSGHLLVDDQFLYWSSGREVLRVPKSGGPPQSLNLEASDPVEMVQDGSRLYWLNWTGERGRAKPLQSVALEGGGASIIVDGLMGANGLNLDGEFLYWVSASGLHRVAKQGGPPEMVYAPKQPKKLVQLLMDAENFYFTEGHAKHMLMKLPRSGGAPVQLAPGIDWTLDAVQDASHLYFIDSSGRDYKLCKVSKSGGPVTVLDRGSVPSGLAVGPNSVYFSDLSDIRAIAK